MRRKDTKSRQSIRGGGKERKVVKNVQINCTVKVDQEEKRNA